MESPERQGETREERNPTPAVKGSGMSCHVPGRSIDTIAQRQRQDTHTHAPARTRKVHGEYLEQHKAENILHRHHHRHRSPLSAAFRLFLLLIFHSVKSFISNGARSAADDPQQIAL
jgi:hypothetical protein